MVRFVSRTRIDLIAPGMDDGFSVEVIEVGQETIHPAVLDAYGDNDLIEAPKTPASAG